MYLSERLNENVFYYKEVISDHQNFIDVLEKCNDQESIHSVIPQWSKWNASDDNDIIFGNKKDFIPPGLDMLQGADRDNAEYLINTLQNAINNVANSFVKDRGLNIEPNMSPFVGVSKWNPGCMLGVHYDRLSGDRTLWWTIVIYLNDDYNGGEISFIIKDIDFTDRQNSKYRPHPDFDKVLKNNVIDFALKPEAGSALVFPSDFPYMHQVHLMKPGKSKYICQSHIFVEGYDPTNEEHRRKYNAGAQYER